ncbi:major facilitator superfamily domain-containing protein [Kalaharituber pfeilii]|nr:major facilitator superfamily domain-containing protein [Kalaharituber pfeilii]
MALPQKWYQFLVGTFASLGSFLFGYDLGIFAQGNDSFKPRFATDSTNEGLVVSLFTAGTFVGGGLQAGAQNIAYVQSGRFVTGIGTDVLCMIVPMHRAELVHPTIHGRVTSLQQFMLGVGAFTASWIGYGCYTGFDAIDDHQWLWQGIATLAQLHAHGDENDPWVRVEFEEIQFNITNKHENSAKPWGELIKNKANFRRIMLAVALQGSIQITGVSAIQYYSPTIFKQIGI